MKGKTCCVTGHRDLPQNEINKIKTTLAHEIDAAVTEWEVKAMYEDFVPERLAKLRTQKGVSARDMSLSLGQANNYINNIENKNRFGT